MRKEYRAASQDSTERQLGFPLYDTVVVPGTVVKVRFIQLYIMYVEREKNNHSRRASSARGAPKLHISGEGTVIRKKYITSIEGQGGSGGEKDCLGQNFH